MFRHFESNLCFASGPRVSPVAHILQRFQNHKNLIALILARPNPPDSSSQCSLPFSKIDSKAPEDYFLTLQNEVIQKGTAPPPRLLFLFERNSAFVRARSFIRVRIRDRATASPQRPCAQDH